MSTFLRSIRYLALGLAGLGAQIAAEAAAPNPRQDSRPAAASEEVEPLARIPFTVEQDRIVLAVRVAGSRPLSMILDTGHGSAAVNLLSPELGEELELVFEDRGVSGGAGEGPGAPVRLARGEDVQIGGLAFPTERIVVMGKRRPGFPKQDGILGARVLLQSCIVEIDFERSQLVLHEPKGFEQRKGWSVLPLDLSTGLPVVEAKLELGGRKEISIRLLFDLGGRASLVLTPNARKGILPPEDSETETFGGAQGRVTAHKGRVERLLLGDLSLHDLPASFTDQMHIEELGVDGILGIHAIRKLDVILDFHRERVHLRRRSPSAPDDEKGEAGSRKDG